jgi:hypothetical protein
MVNAFSFCLYGPDNPRYYIGMRENVVLITAFYPTWVIYVYLGSDVTDDMRGFLASYSNVRVRETGCVGERNMIYRFYAIDEPDVDLMMVRDADSRIHWKDRWAINQFLPQTEFIAHTIRDHAQHNALMMGGLWGLRKSSGLNIHSEYEAYNEDAERGHHFGHDQNFLMDVIYPKVVDRLLVHYSNGRKKPIETAVEFPFTWSNDTYCGRVEINGYIEFPQPPVKPKPLLPIALVRVRDDPVPEPPPVVTLPHVRGPPPNLLTFLNRK